MVTDRESERQTGYTGKDEKLDSVVHSVAALYQYEHAPLMVPLTQREKVRNFWTDTSHEIGGEAGQAVGQLEKALEYAYQLESDPKFTIEDRVALRKQIQKPQHPPDPLAELLIWDVTVARLALAGAFRQPEKIAAISQQTRQSLTADGNGFTDVVRASIQQAPNFFPVPSSRRQAAFV